MEENEHFEYVHAIEKMPELFDYRFLEGKEDGTIRLEGEEGKGGKSKEEIGSLQSMTPKKYEKRNRSILSEKQVIFKRIGEKGDVNLMYVGIPTPVSAFPIIEKTSNISTQIKVK